MASLVFVEPHHKPQPPDYGSIKRASDARLADEAAEAARAAERAAADAEAQRQAQAAIVVYTAPTQVSDHQAVMSAAGIAPSDYFYVDYIISHESGWDPTNWFGKSIGLPYNPYSSAAGLPQALPYSKTGCAWGDAVCQLVWANGYAQERYGGWYGAYTYWQIHGNW